MLSTGFSRTGVRPLDRFDAILHVKPIDHERLLRRTRSSRTRRTTCRGHHNGACWRTFRRCHTLQGYARPRDRCRRRGAATRSFDVLRQAFPDDGVLAEEGDADHRARARSPVGSSIRSTGRRISLMAYLRMQSASRSRPQVNSWLEWCSTSLGTSSSLRSWNGPESQRPSVACKRNAKTR
jgi:hypothetical protein